MRCNFCGFEAESFVPFGLPHPVLTAKRVIGGGPRLHARCPNCQSLDRERLVFLYLSSRRELLRPGAAVLHVASEERLQRALRAYSGIHYVAADLSPLHSDVQLDLTVVPFRSRVFDLVICNHVLEHVVDDRAALAELYRISKPGATAILQVPRSATELTHEDRSIVTARDREDAFGQSDHVRLYGRDYPDRVAEAGFCIEVFDPGEQAVASYALIPGEAVLIGRTRSSDS